MAFKALTPMLQTSDMDRSVAWYSDVLGFRCVNRMGDTWCRLERDCVSLMLMVNAHMGKPQATATQYIYVDDVDGLWTTVAGHTTAEWGPEDMPYGLREFAIRDPDGYLLSFGQLLSAADGPCTVETQAKVLPS